MAQEQYRLRGEGRHPEIMSRLRAEITKLESQLQRLQAEEAPHRFSLMKTYKTMIVSRQELLTQLNAEC
jgi:hypothetical protein